MSDDLKETSTEASSVAPEQAPAETPEEPTPAAVPITPSGPEPVVSDAASQQGAPTSPPVAASVPAPVSQGTTYHKKPFYKLAWFWIAMGLAAFSLCCLVAAAGALAFGGRESRSAGMKMRMQDGMSMQDSMGMQDGRGMRNGMGMQDGMSMQDGGMMDCPYGPSCGGSGSQETTSCPNANSSPRVYKGQEDASPGKKGQR